jgi:hypothetical protein
MAENIQPNSNPKDNESITFNPDILHQLASSGLLDEEVVTFFEKLSPNDFQTVFSEILTKAKTYQDFSATDLAQLINDSLKKATGPYAQEKKRQFLSNPEKVDQFFLTHGLYNIQAEGIKITINEERFRTFLDTNPQLFLTPENQLPNAIHKELQIALKEDLELYESTKDHYLPILDKEKGFKIIEVILHDPATLISDVLKYIGELVQSKSKRSVFGYANRVFNKVFMGPTTQIVKMTNAINNYRNEHVDSYNSAVKLFNYTIERFWSIQKGEPTYMEGGFDLDGEPEDDYWSFPNLGDEEIRKNGRYPISNKLNEQFDSIIEEIALTTWAALKKQIFDRGPDKNTVPLPKRPNEGYWMVLPLSITKNSGYKKINIPWKKIDANGATYEDFLDYFLNALSNNKMVPLHGPQTNEEIKHEHSKDILFDSDLHKMNRKDLANFFDADLRINIEEATVEGTRITRIFHELDSNPVGTRTPTVISLTNYKNNQQTAAADMTVTYAHAPIDGKQAKEEIDEIISLIKKENRNRITNPDLREKVENFNTNPTTLAEFGEEKLIKAISDDTTAESVEDSLSKERRGKGVQSYEMRIGTDIKDKEKESTVTKIYQEYSKNGEIYEALKNKYDTIINPYIILDWALMISLGIDHVHFLEKDGAGLSPVPQELPYALVELIKIVSRDDDKNLGFSFFERRSIKRLSTQIVKSINRFNHARFNMTRKSKIDKYGRIKIGAGPIETLEAAAGPLRDQLSKIASVFIRSSNDIVNKSVLVSVMTKTKKEIENASTLHTPVDTKGFGTSTNSIYIAGIGVTNFGNHGWRIVNRADKVDLVRKKFKKEVIESKMLMKELRKIKSKEKESSTQTGEVYNATKIFKENQNPERQKLIEIIEKLNLVKREKDLGEDRMIDLILEELFTSEMNKNLNNLFLALTEVGKN